MGSKFASWPVWLSLIRITLQLAGSMNSGRRGSARLFADCLLGQSSLPMQKYCPQKAGGRYLPRSQVPQITSAVLESWRALSRAARDLCAMSMTLGRPANMCPWRSKGMILYDVKECYFLTAFPIMQIVWPFLHSDVLFRPRSFSSLSLPFHSPLLTLLSSLFLISSLSSLFFPNLFSSLFSLLFFYFSSTKLNLLYSLLLKTSFRCILTPSEKNNWKNSLYIIGLSTWLFSWGSMFPEVTKKRPEESLATGAVLRSLSKPQLGFRVPGAFHKGGTVGWNMAPEPNCWSSTKLRSLSKAAPGQKVLPGGSRISACWVKGRLLQSRQGAVILYG